jgi:ribosomal protein S14
MTVNLDGKAAGFVGWVNVALTALLFEHPRPFNKAGPRSWAFCGRPTARLYGPLVGINDYRVLIVGGTANAVDHRWKQARWYVPSNQPVSRVGRPDALHRDLKLGRTSLRVSSRASLVSGFWRPRPTDPVPQSLKFILLRRSKPALLLFHLNLLGNADSILGIGLCH